MEKSANLNKRVFIFACMWPPLSCDEPTETGKQAACSANEGLLGREITTSGNEKEQGGRVSKLPSLERLYNIKKKKEILQYLE